MKEKVREEKTYQQELGKQASDDCPQLFATPHPVVAGLDDEVHHPLGQCKVKGAAMFGDTKVDSLATLKPGITEDATGPGVVDGEGMRAAGWAIAASMATGGVSHPLVVASAATSSTSSDSEISKLGGAS